MIRTLLLGSALALGAVSSAAAAQQLPAQAISGTRLDVVATGEVSRVPDIVRISAGVVTQAPTATAAMQQNSQRMVSVVAALRRAGIAERDIQTGQISLNPEYRHSENQPPALIGYRATNEVNVRFRDIAGTGGILDALVAQGANQINGPMFGLDKPAEALDEARTAALRTAQNRANLYAQALGRRVKRILSVSEAGAQFQPYPQPVNSLRTFDAAETKIEPGEQTVGVTLSVSFELE